MHPSASSSNAPAPTTTNRVNPSTTTHATQRNSAADAKADDFGDDVDVRKDESDNDKMAANDDVNDGNEMKDVEEERTERPSGSTDMSTKAQQWILIMMS